MSEFQMALLFPFVPVVAFLLVELLLDIGSNDDEDDGNGGGGIMTPVYVPASNPT